MPSISERALAASGQSSNLPSGQESRSLAQPLTQQMPRREQDEQFSERWRLLAEEFAEADARAAYLEEMKGPQLERMKLDLIAEKGPMADSAAERQIKASTAWSEVLLGMVQARKAANLLKAKMVAVQIEERDLDRREKRARDERYTGARFTT